MTKFSIVAGLISAVFVGAADAASSSQLQTKPCQTTIAEAVAMAPADVTEVDLTDADKARLLRAYQGGRLRPIDEVRVFLVPRENKIWVAILNSRDACFVFPMYWRDKAWLEGALGREILP
jgi:hypothetical protein